MLTYTETGVQHRATNFEPAIDEIWQLLDPARAGEALFEHTLDVLKIAEMAKKLAPVDSPYDRDLALPSCYGNARELGEPKWLQKAVRRERNDQKIGTLSIYLALSRSPSTKAQKLTQTRAAADEAYDARLPAEGATVYQRNKNREAQQDALIEARASWESRQEIPGVRERIKWREKNEEKMVNDVFSSASQAASRRNSSMRASAPVTGSSHVPFPSPGPGEIFGPNFYAQRTPVYRQSLGDAAERRRSGMDLQAIRKSSHAEGSRCTSSLLRIH